jgi:ribosome-binding factor A
VSAEVDASRFFFDLESARPDHRIGSLCRQVQEAVSLALAEAADDARLDGVWVASVVPAAGAGRLLVTLVAPRDAGLDQIAAAAAALEEIKPRLRFEVGNAIHRKRVPDLVLHVVAEPEVEHE